MSSGWRTSSHTSTREAMTLVPPGRGCEPPDGCPRVGRPPGQGLDRDHGPGRGDHRVVSIGHARGARVVALAGDDDPPPAVTQDGRGDGHGSVEVDQAAALLDVQLDEGVDAAQRFGVGSQVGRVEPSTCACLGEGGAVVILERQRALGGDRAGHEPRAEAREAEARPSSSGKTTIARGRPETPRWESRSKATSADATPSGPSNAPPPGTESRWEPVTMAPSRAPPGASHAQMRPLRSVSTSSPRFVARSTNQERRSSSGVVKTGRL